MRHYMTSELTERRKKTKKMVISERNSVICEILDFTLYLISSTPYSCGGIWDQDLGLRSSERIKEKEFQSPPNAEKRKRRRCKSSPPHRSVPHFLSVAFRYYTWNICIIRIVLNTLHNQYNNKIKNKCKRRRK